MSAKIIFWKTTREVVSVVEEDHDMDVPSFIVEAVEDLIIGGRKISAIKLVRSWTKHHTLDGKGCDLKAAKDFVEEIDKGRSW
jgi:ribosomal protein L7/L12